VHERGDPRERRPGGGVATANDTLSVTDNRTGKTYEIDITDGTVRAMDFRQIKVDDDDFGLMTYDPAFTTPPPPGRRSPTSTATRASSSTGAIPSSSSPSSRPFLEVSYLLVHGELPTQQQLDEWTHEITIHTFVHENVKDFMRASGHDAHPMGMLVGSVGALSTFYPDANKIQDPTTATCRRSG
jgi:citrate synthase